VPNLLSKWLRKIVSDAHNAIVSVIVLASLPLLYFYGDQILNQTTRALNQPMPLWVVVSTGLGVLLICLLVLKRTLNPPKNKKDNTDTDTGQESLSETHDKVLELLFQKPATIETICKTLKLSREEANYYLHDLMGKYMVCPPIAYSDPEEWRIDQDGREYVLVKRANA